MWRQHCRLSMIEKPVNAPITNEAANGLINARYTITMAYSSDPQSATAQLFFNIKHNKHLNFKTHTPTGYGYCVFGKVIEGKDVVDQIGKIKTGFSNGKINAPSQDVIIIKAEIVR